MTCAAWHILDRGAAVFAAEERKNRCVSYGNSLRPHQVENATRAAEGLQSAPNRPRPYQDRLPDPFEDDWEVVLLRHGREALPTLRRGLPFPRLLPRLRAIRLNQPVTGLLRRIGDLKEVQVLRRDGAGGQHRVPQPIEQALPVRAAEEDDGEQAQLLGLDQCQGLEQFI